MWADDVILCVWLLVCSVPRPQGFEEWKMARVGRLLRCVSPDGLERVGTFDGDYEAMALLWCIHAVVVSSIPCWWLKCLSLCVVHHCEAMRLTTSGRFYLTMFKFCNCGVKKAITLYPQEEKDTLGKRRWKEIHQFDCCYELESDVRVWEFRRHNIPWFEARKLYTVLYVMNHAEVSLLFSALPFWFELIRSFWIEGCQQRETWFSSSVCFQQSKSVVLLESLVSTCSLRRSYVSIYAVSLNKLLIFEVHKNHRRVSEWAAAYHEACSKIELGTCTCRHLDTLRRLS